MDNVRELKTWPSIIIKNLKAFDPVVYQEPDFGPVVHTKYCWIYKKNGKFVVHDKKDEDNFWYFLNWKGVVLEVIIRFGGFNREDKNETI